MSEPHEQDNAQDSCETDDEQVSSEDYFPECLPQTEYTGEEEPYEVDFSIAEQDVSQMWQENSCEADQTTSQEDQTTSQEEPEPIEIPGVRSENDQATNLISEQAEVEIKELVYPGKKTIPIENKWIYIYECSGKLVKEIFARGPGQWEVWYDAELESTPEETLPDYSTEQQDGWEFPTASGEVSSSAEEDACYFLSGQSCLPLDPGPEEEPTEYFVILSQVQLTGQGKLWLSYIHDQNQMTTLKLEQSHTSIAVPDAFVWVSEIYHKVYKPNVERMLKKQSETYLQERIMIATILDALCKKDEDILDHLHNEQKPSVFLKKIKSFTRKAEEAAKLLSTWMQSSSFRVVEASCLENGGPELALLGEIYALISGSLKYTVGGRALAQRLVAEPNRFVSEFVYMEEKNPLIEQLGFADARRLKNLCLAIFGELMGSKIGQLQAQIDEDTGELDKQRQKLQKLKNKHLQLEAKKLELQSKIVKAQDKIQTNKAKAKGFKVSASIHDGIAIESAAKARKASLGAQSATDGAISAQRGASLEEFKSQVFSKTADELDDKIKAARKSAEAKNPGKLLWKKMVHYFDNLTGVGKKQADNLVDILSHRSSIVDIVSDSIDGIGGFKDELKNELKLISKKWDKEKTKLLDEFIGKEIDEMKLFRDQLEKGAEQAQKEAKRLESQAQDLRKKADKLTKEAQKQTKKTKKNRLAASNLRAKARRLEDAAQVEFEKLKKLTATTQDIEQSLSQVKADRFGAAQQVDELNKAIDADNLSYSNLNTGKIIGSLSIQSTFGLALEIMNFSSATNDLIRSFRRGEGQAIGVVNILGATSDFASHILEIGQNVMVLRKGSLSKTAVKLAKGAGVFAFLGSVADAIVFGYEAAEEAHMNDDDAAFAKGMMSAGSCIIAISGAIGLMVKFSALAKIGALAAIAPWMGVAGIVGIGIVLIGGILYLIFNDTPIENFAEHCFLGESGYEHGWDQDDSPGSVSWSYSRLPTKNKTEELLILKQLLAQYTVKLVADESDKMNDLVIVPRLFSNDMVFEVVLQHESSKSKRHLRCVLDPWKGKTTILHNDLIGVEPTIKFKYQDKEATAVKEIIIQDVCPLRKHMMTEIKSWTRLIQRGNYETAIVPDGDYFFYGELEAGYKMAIAGPYRDPYEYISSSHISSLSKDDWQTPDKLPKAVAVASDFMCSATFVGD